MSNEQCAAIINAIKESVSFVYTNGIPIRAQIPNKANEDAAVASIISAYEAAMEQLITDLPSEE